MRKTKIYKTLLSDFEKAYNHVIMQSDKTYRDYWILTEWKVSIDKLIKSKRKRGKLK